MSNDELSKTLAIIIHRLKIHSDAKQRIFFCYFQFRLFVSRQNNEMPSIVNICVTENEINCKKERYAFCRTQQRTSREIIFSPTGFSDESDESHASRLLGYNKAEHFFWSI